MVDPSSFLSLHIYKKLFFHYFSISSFFLSLLSFLWIGAQFPQEKFLSYGRILTLDFHFLIMCILMAKEKEKEKEVGGEGERARR